MQEMVVHAPHHRHQMLGPQTVYEDAYAEGVEDAFLMG